MRGPLPALPRAGSSEALAEQQALAAELEAEGEVDGYVDEELAECLLALGRGDEARPYFSRAYASSPATPKSARTSRSASSASGRSRPKSFGAGLAPGRGLVLNQHKPDAPRAPDRHGHVPLHRHRGLDAAAARARARRVRRGARGAPPAAQGGIRSPRRRRGRHAGRRILRRLPDSDGGGSRRARRSARTRAWADHRTDGDPHRDADRDGRGIRGRRRAPRRTNREPRPRDADDRFAHDCGAPRRSVPRRSRRPPVCGTSTAQPVSFSSERDDIHPCAPLAPSSCRTPRHPSSAAIGSSSRPCPSCSSAIRGCSPSSGRAVPARHGSRSSWHACWQRRQAEARTSFHSRRHAIQCGSSPRSPRRSGPRSAIRLRSRRGSPASGRTSCSTTSSSCCRTRDPPSRPSSVPRRSSG